MVKQNRTKFTGTENKLMGGALGGWVKKAKELRSTKWQSQNSQGDIKYSLGDTFNNIRIMYGARWVLKLLG